MMVRSSWTAAATALALAVAFAPQGAEAASVTLDLTSLGSLSLGVGEAKTVTLGASVTDVGGVTTTVSGLTVTLLGLSYSGSSIQTSNAGGQRHITNFSTTGLFPTVSQSALNFTSAGAGVTNTKESLLWLNFDSTTADAGGGYADFFEIVVSQSATLDALGFSESSFNGGGKSQSNYVWGYDSTGDNAIGNGDAVSNAIALKDAGTTTYGATSQAFLVGTSGNKSSYRLNSVTFSYTPNVTITVDPTPEDPAPVPLPATGLLLAGAFGGVGLLRRHRRRT